jgi:ATP-binding cassette subfamily F protein uup
MSYKEQREFEELPQRLESLEARKLSLTAEVSTPEFYAQDEQAIRDGLQTLELLEQEISQAWERWAELDALAAKLAR